MKKCLVVVLLASFISVICTGCGNHQIFDLQYTFNKAIINVGTETITVDVAKWRDYGGEQLQITASDGTVYLTSSFNCTLIKE